MHASVASFPGRSGAKPIAHRVAMLGCVLALACVTSAAQAKPGEPTKGPSQGPAVARASQMPPPIRLSSGSVALAIVPFSACWSTPTAGMCYDGRPPRPLPSMGGMTGPLTLAFARDNWRFSVSVLEDQQHSTTLDLHRTGPRQWRLATRALPDGRYRAQVFGQGPQGDVAAAFAFTRT